MIEQIIPSLPVKQDKIENAYESCTEKFVKVEEKEFSIHLEKAKSDLQSVKTDYEKQNWDWSIVKSYYSIHHAINALLIKEKGFYSKDHICAILAIKRHELIPEELYLKLRRINKKFSDFTGLDITYMLRKISNYDVVKWKQLTQNDALSVYSLAKEIVSFAEKRCYE